MTSRGKTLLLIGLLVWINPAFAIRMVPIVAEVNSSDSTVEQSFRVDNPGGTPAAVEINVLKRQTTLDGKEVREPADDQFVVFPEQMVLMPGESQLIRIQWLGTTPVEEELAYRVIAEELPVDFNEAPKRTGAGPQISLLMRYEAMLYIQPAQISAELSVVSAGIVEHDGAKHLELVLVNAGNSHVIVGDPEVSIGQQHGAVYQLEDDVTRALKVNMLAGEKRRFLLPLPDHIEPNELDVQFRYKSTD
jgi:fimbrial chaperone protein